jgi:hypothetical protein
VVADPGPSTAAPATRSTAVEASPTTALTPDDPAPDDPAPHAAADDGTAETDETDADHAATADDETDETEEGAAEDTATADDETDDSDTEGTATEAAEADPDRLEAAAPGTDAPAESTAFTEAGKGRTAPAVALDAEVPVAVPPAGTSAEDSPTAACGCAGAVATPPEHTHPGTPAVAA